MFIYLHMTCEISRETMQLPIQKKIPEKLYIYDSKTKKFTCSENFFDIESLLKKYFNTTTFIVSSLNSFFHQIRKKVSQDFAGQFLDQKFLDISHLAYSLDIEISKPAKDKVARKIAKITKTDKKLAQKDLKSYLKLFELQFAHQNLNLKIHSKLVSLEISHLKFLHRMELTGLPYSENYSEKLLASWYEMKFELEKNCEKYIKNTASKLNFTFPINLDDVPTAQHVIYLSGFKSGNESPKPKRRRSVKPCKFCNGVCSIEAVPTNAEFLEKLIESERTNPLQTFIFKKLIAYRQLKRRIDDLEMLKSYNENGRITYFCSFTETGRIQMEQPSLLTISNETIVNSQSIRPRDCIRAGEGKTILSMDFKQIEQRVIAFLSQDKKLIDILNSGEDFFTHTAREIFGVGSDQNRKKVKALTYGLNYGMGTKTLSEKLNITEPEAENIKEKYFQLFPQLQEYRLNLQAECEEKDVVISSILGRKRKINKGKFTQAISTCIQSGAADIVRVASLAIQQLMKTKEFSDVSCLLQIHDELLFEMEEKILKRFAKVVQKAVQISLKKYIFKSGIA